MCTEVKTWLWKRDGCGCVEKQPSSEQLEMPPNWTKRHQKHTANLMDHFCPTCSIIYEQVVFEFSK